MLKVVLPRDIAEEMIAHAREGSPLEVCGILAAKDGKVTQIYRAHNADQSPVTYRIDPQDQLRIFKDIEESGLELWGIYHSHPASAAFPSHTDVRMAFYPEAYYLIVSLQRPEKPLIRAFRIYNSDKVLEEKVVVE